MGAGEHKPEPLVSVVVLNYNGAKWIRKCIESILAQSIRSKIELVVADNSSTDGSDRIAEDLLRNEHSAVFAQLGDNFGFAEGNNRAAKLARGKYLFFMNNDAWMESSCLEVLLAETEAANAAVATPYVMNWADDEYQWVYVHGYDLFGLPSFRIPPSKTERLFMPPGCSYLIRRQLFHRIGEFDSWYFMYAEEFDLSWRVWIAGESSVIVPRARLHHRGAADVNPHGGERVVAYQTSESKRYYTNRNCLVSLLKNSENILLLLVPFQIVLLLLESVIALLLVRRWSFIRRSYFGAIQDALNHWDEIRKSRTSLADIRQRSDFAMLQFLRFRMNRWDELMQTVRMGIPKVAGR
jgi:GT2 family glycosyltransferase